MLRNLRKRLERLEARLLPTLEAPRTLIVQFVTETGEVDGSITVVMDQSRPTVRTTFGHSINRRRGR